MCQRFAKIRENDICSRSQLLPDALFCKIVTSLSFLIQFNFLSSIISFIKCNIISFLCRFLSVLNRLLCITLRQVLPGWRLICVCTRLPLFYHLWACMRVWFAFACLSRHLCACVCVFVFVHACWYDAYGCLYVGLCVRLVLCSWVRACVRDRHIHSTVRLCVCLFSYSFHFPSSTRGKGLRSVSLHRA